MKKDSESTRIYAETVNTTNSNPKKAMKRFIAAATILSILATFTGCNELQQALGPIANNLRTFTYSFKKLPQGTTLARAKLAMETHDRTTTNGAESYIGHKDNNTLYYRLTAVPPASNGGHQGQILINVRDQDVTVPTATGALIDITPMPQVGDTITLADFHIYITEDLPVEFQNANNPNSYFRFVLKSVDFTNNKASGWFEGLVEAPAGPHAGEIYAITGGEFIMDIGH